MNAHDRRGVWMIASVAAVVLAVLGLRSNAGRSAAAAPDNCTGEVVRNTVVVIDQTDAVPTQTREEIVSRAMNYIDAKVVENERVSVFFITEKTTKDLTPAISVCRPRREGSRLTESVKLIERRFREKFERPVQAALLSKVKRADQSPLAEALTDLSASKYLRGEKNTILVFSDLLQHTQRFSLYRCDSGSLAVDGYRASRVGAIERPRFQNVDVFVNIIPRLDNPGARPACVQFFWQWFFGDNRAPNAANGDGPQMSFDYLPGGESVP